MVKSKQQGLNPRQEKFVLEYHRTGHQRNSAIAAGYSERSAGAQASVLLRNPKIQARLAQLRDEAAKGHLMSITEAHGMLSKIARAKATDVIDIKPDDVQIKTDLNDTAEDALSSISFQYIISDAEGLKSVESVSVKSVSMHNKVAAINQILKLQGAYSDISQAREALKRYGLALVPDLDSELGWRLEEHLGD